MPQQQLLGEMSRDHDSKGDWHGGSCATDSVAGYLQKESRNPQCISTSLAVAFVGRSEQPPV
jgi:hypothetical protein